MLNTVVVTPIPRANAMMARIPTSGDRLVARRA